MRRRLLRVGGLTLAVLAALVGWVAVRWHVAGRRSDPGPLPPPVVMPADLSLPFEPPEELSYEFGWNGMPAATLSMRTTEAEQGAAPALALSFDMATLPALSQLWSFAAQGRTLVDPTTLRPLSSWMLKQSKDKQETITADFDWPAGVVKVHEVKESDERTKEKRFSRKVGLDMPAAFLVLRSQPGEPQLRNLRLVNGDDTLELVLNPVGREQIDVRAGSFGAIVYEVTVRELEEEAQGEPGPVEPGRSKYRGVKLWVDTDTRMPLKLEAVILVGNVYAELVGVVRDRVEGQRSVDAAPAPQP